MDENKKNDMDTGDGFFDDIPQENQATLSGGGTGENSGGYYGNYVPAPMKPRKSTGKRVGKILGIIALSLAVFFSGMLTTWLCLDDGIRTLIKIKRTIDKEYYQDVSDDEFYRVLFSAINDDLLDPYSEYMTYEQFHAAEQSLAGRRSGIGVSFITKDENQEDQMMVYSVSENSPAEAAGLQSGDKIIGFGKTADTIKASVDYEKGLKPFLNSVADGEPFYLKIQRGGQDLLIQLSREEYVESYVSYRTNKTSYGFIGENALTYVEKGKALSCLPEGTAYIKLSQFTGNAAAGFQRIMQQFKTDNMKNLVLDLRGNGGGYLDYAQYIAQYFCKNATGSRPLLTVADYGEKQERYYASGNVYRDYFAEDSRIVVLADIGTASASECLIGCMVDYGAIGYEDICLSTRGGVAKTFGKGIMQTTFYLDASKKDFLKLTTAELRWPVSGKSIHARGILPEDGALTVAENYEGETELINAVTLLFS